LQPFTPMGVAVLRAVLASMPGGAGGLVDVAGRIYADVTDVVRRKGADRWLPRFAESDLGPRVRAVLEQVLADPRFAPLPGRIPPRCSRRSRTICDSPTRSRRPTGGSSTPPRAARPCSPNWSAAPAAGGPSEH